MLKYIVAFCIISFCDSSPRPTLRYNNLVLILHFPITSFFVRQVSYKNVDTKSLEFAEYIRDYTPIFDTQKWIIYGLWPINAQNKFITCCRSAWGEVLKYDHNTLDQNLKETLKSKWPVLKVSHTQESLFEVAYNIHGSCVSENTTFYFSEAVRLLEKYDLELLLRESGVVTAGIYTLEFLESMLMYVLDVQAYIKCLPARESAAQYLLEIQLCFDVNHELVDCSHRRTFPTGPHLCNPNIPIIYPETPT